MEKGNLPRDPGKISDTLIPSSEAVEAARRQKVADKRGDVHEPQDRAQPVEEPALQLGLQPHGGGTLAVGRVAKRTGGAPVCGHLRRQPAKWVGAHPVEAANESAHMLRPDSVADDLLHFAREPEAQRTRGRWCGGGVAPRDDDARGHRARQEPEGERERARVERVHVVPPVSGQEER
eukprot:4210191-Prymnesium_polylepis.1